jgi:predicted RecB family nuclease
MTVTSSLFDDYLKCPTKCFLKSCGENDGRNAYANCIQTEIENYRNQGRKRLTDALPSGEWIPGSANVGDLNNAKCRLAVDLAARTQDLASSIHAVERVQSEGRGKPTLFVPIRFVVTNKLTRDDRLLVAFLLSEIIGSNVPFGKIIHGDHYAMLKVKTLPLAGEVAKLTRRTAKLLSSPSPPNLVLNRHCVECEFQFRCREKAVEKDDLSLLPRMTEKERRSFHSRGIFTVTQLSYTYRPRRSPKRIAQKPRKYYHALKALAVRQGKIHVMGSPELTLEGTAVYLDVEGLPDRGFYYLIGVRFKSAEEIVQHSLWADSMEQERRIWSDFLTVLSGIKNPVLIHYGSYESRFLKQMSQRYGNPEKDLVAATLASPLNLLSIMFGSVYFPNYSNGLKDCAKSLGFEWSTPNASGALAVVWRLQWEKDRNLLAKELLTKYNAEDCEALQHLTEFVSSLSTSTAELPDNNQSGVVKVESLPRNALFKFRKVPFQVPELEMINQAAYWKYQRARILVKSSRRIRNVAERAKNPTQPKLNPNRIIRCPAPLCCFRCCGKTLYKHRECSKTVVDLKFGVSGIKRWITRYLFDLYRCPQCKAVFRNHNWTWSNKKFGENLRTFVVYENIGLGIPQQRVAIFLKEVLGLDLRRAAVNKFKESAAAFYEGTYEKLVRKLTSGRLIHADETRVNLKAGAGYVWAFTNLEDVVYVYAASREGDLIHSLLKDFKGVLVSDFYAAYDSMNCPQQKCLIHLIRDLNEDLMNEPFNEEMKGLVSEFALLLQAIISTVDRFGLKARFLRVHKRSVERFFKRLAQREYQTETALKCKTRLQKNRCGLFTFLDFDGIPWNNNNAEHAIKAFALLRRDLNGLANEKGIREYLILLSICESCKFKGMSFLEFLRSGKTDIDAFAVRKQRRGRKISTVVAGDNTCEILKSRFDPKRLLA